MGYFLQSGDAFVPAPSKDALLEGLPPAVYTLEESMTGWYFKRGEDFQPLPKLYGDLERHAARVFTSFAERPGNTGVLLSGEKGSGKSLLGRVISHNGGELGMPTILVNKHIAGSELGKMLGQLSSPAVIFMDEFEKIFHEAQAQEEVLGLLDGTHSSRHLFVLTVNDTHRMDKHLKNRPGRLYYHIEFHGLDESFVSDYCGEHLRKQEWVSDVKRVASLFDAFNFDMLQALVEEVNRFGEPPLQAVRYLNISPTALEESYEVAVVTSRGKKLKLYQNTFYGAPLSLRKYSVHMDSEDQDKEALSPEEVEYFKTHAALTISQSDLFECRVEEGVYEFRKDGFRVILTRARRATNLHWTAAF